MQRSKYNAPSGQAPKLGRTPMHHAKFITVAPTDIREELWWSRRLASGSDWMEEWMGKPSKR